MLIRLGQLLDLLPPVARIQKTFVVIQLQLVQVLHSLLVAKHEFEDSRLCFTLHFNLLETILVNYNTDSENMKNYDHIK